MGPKAGHYAAEFECTIVHNNDGRTCGTKRKLYHKAGKAVSTSNLVTHIREKASKCDSHKSALSNIDKNNSKYAEVDGEQFKVYNFSESFEHHVDLLWLRTKGLSFNMTTQTEFRDYVRGYDPRAAFPHSETLRRIAVCVQQLQKEERVARTARHIKKFKGGQCVGIQLDMWTDTATHTAYAAVTQTTCEDPEDENSDIAELFLRSEVMEFGVFPMSAKTGPNIRVWFVKVLKDNGIPYDAVSGVTPDGAADGQCALSQIEEISEKVDTCLLQQLQRGVLYSVGLAGVKSKNPECKSLLRKHNRVVMLSRQSLAFGKALNIAQTKAGVPSQSILNLEVTATTRWGNQFKQINKNNLLRHAIDAELHAYKQANRNNLEAIVETNESEEGSKVGTPVAAADIGLHLIDWDNSEELESFLSYPFEIKETLEHSGICTGSQAMILLHDLKEGFCDPGAHLDVKEFPLSLKLIHRERVVSIRDAEDLSSIVTTSIQDETKTAKGRESQVAKKQKLSGGLFRGASAVLPVEGALGSSPSPVGGDNDAVQGEIRRWEALSNERLQLFFRTPIRS
ncbi:hypothetical protein CYMTET_30770 [Cymbomonas tetramitiformis]|uniref:Uncharacterized protein n=1 Tax=Cymbomonas tetramitiformis TaxID=36881 RepID=A0AAE0FI65_9CHLO|nr:hypothetical protein CYMTET_30770 [Cymbomonas tetramitiformis]